MSDVAALTLSMAGSAWFFIWATVIAASGGGRERLPRFALTILGIANAKPRTGMSRLLNLIIAAVWLGLGEGAIAAYILANIGHGSVSVTVLLCAQPVFAIAWTVYLLRTIRGSLRARPDANVPTSEPQGSGGGSDAPARDDTR